MKIIAVKVVILGSQGVGKTSLVTRYENKSFHRTTSSTIGASFSNVEILMGGNTKVKMQVWDTAGQERFRAMAPMYYRGADAALLVFDLTDYSTFTDVKTWVHELRTRVGEEVMLVLVGNKCDLVKGRAVDKETAEGYATSIGASFIETSALDNTGVQEMFNMVAVKMAKQAEVDDNSKLRVYPADSPGKNPWQEDADTSRIHLTESRGGLRSRCCWWRGT